MPPSDRSHRCLRAWRAGRVMQIQQLNPWSQRSSWQPQPSLGVNSGCHPRQGSAELWLAVVDGSRRCHDDKGSEHSCRSAVWQEDPSRQTRRRSHLLPRPPQPSPGSTEIWTISSDTDCCRSRCTFPASVRCAQANHESWWALARSRQDNPPTSPGSHLLTSWAEKPVLRRILVGATRHWCRRLI